jgi:sulfonate transport system substrate-binding protein
MIKHGFSRRDALTLFASTLALSACGAVDKRPLLKVGSQRGGTKALMLSSGALTGAGFAVEWSEFPSAQTLLEAIGSGAVDVGLTGDAPFLFAFESGSPIKAVSAQIAQPRQREAVALVVPTHSAARSIADMKGKRVATTRGSIGHYLVLRALDDAHLPLDYVQFTWLSPGDTKAAFASGSVDAWATWVPYLTGAIADGARIIADGYDLIHGYGFEVANEQAIKNKPVLLADFLDREAKALTWADGHKDDFAAVLAKETGLPFDIAKAMVLKNGRRAVPINEQVISDQQVVLDTFRKSREINPLRPLSQAFNRPV